MEVDNPDSQTSTDRNTIVSYQLKLVCQLKIDIERFVQHLKRQHNLIEPIHQLKPNGVKLQLKSILDTFWKEFNKESFQKATEKLNDSEVYDQIWDLFVSWDKYSNSDDKVPSIQLSLICKLKDCMNALAKQLEVQSGFVGQILMWKKKCDTDDANLQWKISALQTFSQQYDRYLKRSHPKFVISNIYDKLWDLFLSYDNVDSGVTIPDFDNFLDDIIAVNCPDSNDLNHDITSDSAKLSDDMLDEIVNSGQLGSKYQDDYEILIVTNNNSETALDNRILGSNSQSSNTIEDNNDDGDNQQCDFSPNNNVHNPKVVYSFRCDFGDCTYLGQSRLDLDRHKFEIHSFKRFKCDLGQCTYRGQSQLDLDRHKIEIHSIKGFKCDFIDCTYLGLSQLGLDRHKFKIHSLKGFKCNFIGCTYLGPNRLDLDQHKFEIHSLKRFKCDIVGCAYLGPNRLDLDRHKFEIHSLKPFKCDFIGCGYSTDKKRYLPQHMKSHNPIREWKCNYCKYESHFKSDLKKHQSKIHSIH